MYFGLKDFSRADQATIGRPDINAASRDELFSNRKKVTLNGMSYFTLST